MNLIYVSDAKPIISSGNKVTININGMPEPEYVSQVIVVCSPDRTEPKTTTTHVTEEQYFDDRIGRAEEEMAELLRSRVNNMISTSWKNS